MFVHSSTSGITTPTDGRLYVVSSDGSDDPQPVGSGGGVEGFAPDWSPGDRTIAFDARSSRGAGLSFQWNLGDGAYYARATPVHTYLRPTATVTLTVSESGGGVATLTKPVLPARAATAISPSFTATPSSNDPLQVTFTDSTVYPDGAFLQRWSFGDGSAAQFGSGVTHRFATSGSSTITLEVEALNGGTAKATTSVVVGSATIPAPPFASFATQAGGSKVVFTRRHTDFLDTDVGTARQPYELAVMNPDGSSIASLRIRRDSHARCGRPGTRMANVSPTASKSRSHPTRPPSRGCRSHRNREIRCSPLSGWQNVSFPFTQYPSGADDPSWDPSGERMAFVYCQQLMQTYGKCGRNATNIAVMGGDGTSADGLGEVRLHRDRRR